MPEPFPSNLSPARERLRRLMERYRATEIAPRDDKKRKYELTVGEATVTPARDYDLTVGEARIMTPDEVRAARMRRR